jgi:hypothetical protein
MASHAITLAILAGFTDQIVREFSAETFKKPEVAEQVLKDAFKWPRKDPFAERLAEMKEREKSQ